MIKKESKIEKAALTVAIKELTELQGLQKAAVRVSRYVFTSWQGCNADRCLDRGESAHGACSCADGVSEGRASIPRSPSEV